MEYACYFGIFEPAGRQRAKIYCAECTSRVFMFQSEPMIELKIPKLLPRALEAHKGSFGHALLIGGATGMTGAISIAGIACLRMGAGLVTLGIPQCSHPVVASFDPHYMTLPLPCDSAGRLISDAAIALSPHLMRVSCVAIGPGLGRSDASDRIVASFFENFERPLLVDADGLNALCESQIWQEVVQGTTSLFNRIRILTPHPGEWERLCGVSAKDRAGQIAAANELAARTKCIVLLKGHQTLITNGKDSFINSTGNSSMAVGGSGDCLTGIIAALVCQGMGGLDAARLGAHLHGLAGDIAHEELGTPSTLAMDLIRYLPDALRNLGEI